VLCCGCRCSRRRPRMLHERLETETPQGSAIPKPLVGASSRHGEPVSTQLSLDGGPRWRFAAQTRHSGRRGEGFSQAPTRVDERCCMSQAVAHDATLEDSRLEGVPCVALGNAPPHLAPLSPVTFIDIDHQGSVCPPPSRVSSSPLPSTLLPQLGIDLHP
jgi:hypothetical protein